jgi:hypothetical protein
MTAEIPWLIDCEPRPVQLEALRRSYLGHPGDRPAVGWGHFLEMRLGKTPLALNEFQLMVEDRFVDKMVVISPNAYKFDWELEAQRFMSWVPFHAYESGQTAKARAFMMTHLRSPWGMVVNYEALVSEDAHKLLWDAVDENTLMVFDESIKLKNPDGLSSKRLLAISGQAAFVRVMTGLPMVQGPQDLYQQLKIIRALPGVNFFAFRNKFCKMGGFKNKKIVGVREENKPALTHLVEQNSFTARRADWGKVTVPVYFTDRVKMPPEQLKAYQDMNREMVLMLESGETITASMVITKAMKLQQISSGFITDEAGVTHDLIPRNTIPKLVRLRAMLEDEVRGKVIVPFHFRHSGDVLMEQLADFNPAVIRGHGWMNANGRDAALEKRRFNTDPNCRLMLLNITAGKYGHDLSGVPGDQCGHMFFYENNYSLDDRMQIEMRNVVAKQDWVNVYIDFVASGVEEAIIKALVEKLDIAESILGSYGAKVRHA